MWIRRSLQVLCILCASAQLNAVAVAQTTAWDAHMEAAIAAHRRAAFDSAERHLQAAKEEAEDFTRDDPRLAQTLMALSAVNFERNRYDEAEPYLEEVLALRREALGPDHRQVGITLNALGVVRARDNRPGEALPLFRQALTIIDRTAEPRKSLLEQVLGNLAGVLVAEGHYAEAEPHFLRQIAILEDTLGERHPDTAQAMESYAALLRLTGRPDEAAELESKIDKILKR